MKKKDNILFKYLEAILGCVLLVMFIYWCIYGNIFFKMLPIACIVGILGQVVFNRKFMTTIFTFIISIVLLQIKIPSQLLYNLFISIQITVCCLFGEICGYYIRKLYYLIKKKRKNNNKLKIRYLLIVIISLFISVVINSFFNGNYISYFYAKKSLVKYFSNEYSSSSRFKVFLTEYNYGINPSFIFYTNDTINNNNIGYFVVFLKEKDNVQDEYKQKILDKISDDLSANLDHIESSNIDVEISYDDTHTLTINFYKNVDDVNKISVEEYAKEISEYMEEALKIEDFNLIEQIKVVLESNSNAKDSVSSYIYMSGYKDMLKNGQEEPYEYIVRALNVEYFE